MPRRADRFSPYDRERRIGAIREALERDPIAHGGYHRGFRPPNTFVRPDLAGGPGRSGEAHPVVAIVYTTYAPRTPEQVEEKGGQCVLAVGVTDHNFAACVQHLGELFVLGAEVDGKVLSTSEVWQLLELDSE